MAMRHQRASGQLYAAAFPGLPFRCWVPVLLIILTVAPLFAASPTCLRCHPVHYREQGNCVGCHRGNDRTVRPALAHHDLIPGPMAGFRLQDNAAVTRGKRLAGLLACRRCHLLERRGNRLASNLDQAVSTIPLPRLRQAVQQPAWYMPDFRLARHDQDDLLTYLLFAGQGRSSGEKQRETPLVVHFVDDRHGNQDAFSRHCGGCHLTLTERWGGLGRGRVAPNLAGLLGEFYPRTFQEKHSWTRTTLKGWLANPRKSRPLATMPPISLTESECADVMTILQPLPASLPK